MADVVEVVVRLGDSIVSVAHGPSITVGESGDIYAPAPCRTFALESSANAIVVGEPISTTVGLLTIDIRRVPAASDRIPRKRPEGRAATYIGISLLVHLALWGTSMRVSPIDNRVAHVGVVRSVPVHIAHPHDALPPQDLDDGSPAPVVAMSLEQGLDVGLISDFVGHASVDVVVRPTTASERRDQAIAAARNAGVLGADSLRGERALGDIPGTGSPASGFDGRAIDGAARGESSQQAFASDRRRAGGCTHEPCGSIDAGRYHTLCIIANPGEVCSHGTNEYGDHMRPHVATVPTIRMCGAPDRYTPSPCVAIVGDLDKAIIRRYIRRKLAAIVGCYEKQLLVDADLTGIIDTTFIIDSTGVVHDVVATGVHPDVSTCVATVIESIQFPRAHNGGFTKVHYPLSFIVAGS